MSFTADGKTSSWKYDAKGNRLSETESTGGIYSPSQSVTYYPNTDLIKTYGDWKFNYDRNGSLTSRGKIAEENPSVEEPFASWIFDASDGEVWYYEYDLSGRMTKSSSSKKGTGGLTERASYAYDYRGLLVRKTYSDFTAGEGVSINSGSTATVTEWYEYNQNGQLLYTEKQSGSKVKKTDYIWAETTLWCEVDDGKVYWHHTDHLGTTEAVTDETGRVVWSAEYEAFGSVLSENGSMTFTPSFTGKMLDECSGLYYFNARWYDSEMGRFTTQDPARDGYNWYGYCNGNPVNFLDPDGKKVIIGISEGIGLYNYIDPGHVFIMYINERNPQKSIMLDASGQYGGNRGSSDTFEGNWRYPISIRDYLGYFKTEKETLKTFELILTLDEEENVRREIESVHNRSWLTCAIKASEIIDKTEIIEGFQRKNTPKGVLKQLNKYAKENPDKVITKQYDFKTGKEIKNNEEK